MFSKWMYLGLMIWCIIYGLVGNPNETMFIIIAIWFIGSAICLEIQELREQLEKGDKNDKRGKFTLDK